MKHTYTVTMSDGSSFTILATTYARARTAAYWHLVHYIGMESWMARNERLRITKWK